MIRAPFLTRKTHFCSQQQCGMTAMTAMIKKLLVPFIVLQDAFIKMALHEFMETNTCVEPNHKHYLSLLLIYKLGFLCYTMLYICIYIYTHIFTHPYIYIYIEREILLNMGRKIITPWWPVEPSIASEGATDFGTFHDSLQRTCGRGLPVEGLSPAAVHIWNDIPSDKLT